MSWETTSGLVEKYEATVDEAWFATDLNYRNGEVPQLYFRLVNIDGIDTDEWTEKFAVGNGWEVIDGGASVQRTDGKDKPFHKQTRYGMLIDRVIGKDTSIGDAFDGCLEVLQERGDPTNAKVWEGMRFRFELHGVDYGTINGEQVGLVEFILPAVYIGIEGDETAGASSNGNGTVSLDTLIELAKSVGSHKEFVNEALDKVSGLNKDDELLEKVLDSSDAGLYATSR